VDFRPDTRVSDPLRLSRRTARRAAAEGQAAEAERAEAIQFVTWLEQSLLTAHLEDFPQTRSDEQWSLLVAHDEQAVCTALDAAFEDIKSPAVCIDAGVDYADRFATVLIVFGPEHLVLPHRLAMTPDGTPALQARTTMERNAFYLKALGSTVLATVKKAFAVLPSATEVRVVVLRREPQASSPADLEWIYAARFPLSWTARLPWNVLDPGQILLNAPDSTIERGAAGAVVGMALSDRPGLAEIVSVVRAAV
jgi:hypothetical protein